MAVASLPVMGNLEAGQLFETWSDFQAALAMYSEKTGTAWRVKYRSKTITVNKNKNMTLDASRYPYYQGEYVCVHFGPPTNNSRGIREREQVLPCNCVASFTISYFAKKECYRINRFNNVHVGHQPDVLLGPFYPINRRLTPEQQKEVFNQDAIEPNNGLLLDAVRLTYGKNTQSSDITNLRQKFKSKLGDNCDLVSVIKELHETHCCTIHYSLGKGGKLEYLVFQTSYMRSVFQLYPEVLFVDSTYASNKFDMPLLQIMVKDCNGVAKPVCFAFMKQETKEHIQLVLSIFSEFKDRIQTVMVDKSWVEINAIREVFPDSAVLLCHFHAIMTFKLETGQLCIGKTMDEKEDILILLKNMIFSPSEESFSVRLAEVLNAAPEMEDYLTKCWLNIKPMWVMFYRHTLCTLGDNTNNRLEASNGQVKKYIDRACTLAECLNRLFIHSLNQQMTASGIQANDFIKCLYLPAHLSPYAVLFNKITSYARKMLRKQIAILQVCEYEVREIESSLYVCYKSKRHLPDLEMSSCSCSFYHNFLLPCRHLLVICRELECPLEELSINPRWLKRLPLSNSVSIQRQSQPPSIQSHDFPESECRVLTVQEKFRKAAPVTSSICSFMSTLGTSQFKTYLEYLEQFELLMREGRDIPSLKGQPIEVNCSQQLPPAQETTGVFDQNTVLTCASACRSGSQDRCNEQLPSTSVDLSPPASLEPVAFVPIRSLRSRLARIPVAVAPSATPPSLVLLKTAIIQSVKRRGRPRNISKSSTSYMPKKKKARNT